MGCFLVPGRLALAFAIGFATLCVSSSALAYCRMRTCSLDKTDVQTEQQCKHEDGCMTEGATLHWPNACLRYAVQLDGSALIGLDADQVAELVEQAFALWRSAECPNGGNPRFEANFQGFVSCDQHETVCASANGNVNVIMFHDDFWPYRAIDLGMTTPAAGTESGLISDADIEINAQAISGSTPPMYDLFPVLAHEIGHFLGLTHSNVGTALMAADYGSLPMSGGLLTADDAAGICAIYPPKDKALSCSTPAPAYDACRNPDPDAECTLSTVRHETSGGCSVARAPAKGSPMGPLVVVLSLGFAWLGRRRRASRSAEAAR